MRLGDRLWKELSWRQMREDEPGWSRGEWALWWLDHDEVDEAARVLEPGDAIVVGRNDFRDLSAALSRRGLVAAYEDGRAFVYTREQARQVLGESADVAPDPFGERRPPGRTSPAPGVVSAKRSA
jgi:hypothetical protein